MSRRVAIGNLVESMDYMDPTRSHESLPSRRMCPTPVWPLIAAWAFVVALALAVLAVAVR